MLGIFFNKKKKNLATRCHNYLVSGPPEHMGDYVPESITEVIIAHGAKQKKLNDKLLEIAHIMSIEASDFTYITDPVIKKYMQDGQKLVQEVIEGASMGLNAKLTKAHKLISLFYVLLPAPILAYMFFHDSKLSILLMVFSFFAFFAVIHYIAALGARKGQKWGKLMSRIIGAFMLLGFPIGTVIGIYILSCTESVWQPA